jgi:alcohol dehydrogenase YqhD (iron-dependent ADH family)
VLTIPAAGSEASKGSVISREDTLQKLALNADVLRPRFAILNPELTFTLPPFQTAAGVTDIMSHIMERYFTLESDVDFTDRLCEASLKTAIHNAPIALARPDNYPARAEIMWAGTIAHNDLLGTGRIADWASHRIEHELSAQYDVTHGAGLAVIFPAWMRHVYSRAPERFVQFATRVWDVEYRAGEQERVIREGIARLTTFFRRIGMPTTLAELGITDRRYEKMAEQAVHFGPLGNFKLTAEDVVKIYELAEKAAE